MMLRIAIQLLCLCLGASLAWPDPLIEEKQESTVTVTQDGGAVVTHVVNRRYESAIVADERDAEPKLVHVLASIEIDRTMSDAEDQETEILSSIVRANFRTIDQTGLSRPALQIETEGDEATISEPFLIVTRWGCCALQSSYQVYSMLSGHRLFSATGGGEFGDWITLDSRHRPNEQRYAAIHVAPTMSDEAELGPDEKHAIAISYASGNDSIQRLIVSVPMGRNSDDVLDWLPKLSWVTADQPEGTDHIFVASDSPPEATYDGMILRLQLDENTRIDIPLEKDRLVPAKAVLPAGFELTEK